jgi:hypothetical protein
MISPKVPKSILNELKRDYAIMKGEELRYEIMDEENSELDMRIRFAVERDNVFEVINANTFTMYA